MFLTERGLYLVALRWCLEHEVLLLAESKRRAGDPAEAAPLAAEAGARLDFLLLAAVERAPEVAAEVARALNAVDAALRAVLESDPAPASAERCSTDRAVGSP